MKGLILEAVSPIQQTTSLPAELKAIRDEAFSQLFDWLFLRCKPYAEAGGNYIE